MKEFTPEELSSVQEKARPKGTLPHLPGRDSTLTALRAWLTRAFQPPDGYRVEGFERHGRRLSDAGHLLLKAPAGAEVRFRFPEQRALAKSPNLRSSVASITDGFCRMANLSASECSDVWVALCTIAHVVAHQDEVEEFRESLESFLRVTEVEGRYTLTQPGRYDALLALQNRGLFERRHALSMAVEANEANWTRRPIVLLDFKTTERWVRVPEVGTYLRHVLGQQLGHGVLDGRMSEIGAERERFEVRNGKAHPHASLYRLPAADETEGTT